MVKTRWRRPVIMDGHMRFVSIAEAARWVKENHGSLASIKSITSSVYHVVAVGHGTVYGHTFADDTWPTTPAEYDERIKNLNELVVGMFDVMKLSCWIEQPITPKALEAWRCKVNELVGGDPT